MRMSDGLTLDDVLNILQQGEEWFTKDKKEATLVEKTIMRELHMGYQKTVDMSWGFQATFLLGPEESKYWDHRDQPETDQGERE